MGIPVKTPDGQYTITIETGLLSQLGRQAEAWGLHKNVVVATDTTVETLYGRKLADKLNAPLIRMSDGEQYKNLDTVRQLYDQLVETEADRQTTLIAVGGGVVGDTMGFVAATYMRGIRFVQIPTTLLAMVDSSVGGKVGVDLPQGKNLVGAFKQPEAVIIDPDVLKTLPQNQWRAGMAEIIKHGLLADPTLLDPALHHPSAITELIQRAVQVKVDVVEQDPYEQNIRAHLNLGHTFAHAIEQVTHYQWLHGYAVGLGLLLATKLSVKMGLCGQALVTQVDNLLEMIGLPRTIGDLDSEAIYGAMATDKKWQGGKSRFILLEDIGQPRIVTGVPPEMVIEVLEESR